MTDEIAKHTPGPWKIVYQKGENNDAYWIGLNSLHSIAEVRNGADDEEYGGPEREVANARLIAAAPDSHEANRLTIAALAREYNIPTAASDDWIYDTLGSGLSGAYFASRAAILKATSP